MIEIRLATEKDLEEMCRITQEAKDQLKGLGLSQWQKGYPNKEVWEQDIQKQRAWVAEENGRLLGQFTFQTTPDPSYGEIQGAWFTDGEYAAMHRVCVSADSRGRGVAGKLFAFGFEKARELGFSSMRIDTHPGNLPMQNALGKAGFCRCGEIRLAEGPEKGDPRIAFEKIL